jgi:plasmid maintenance system killer protein
MKRKLIKWIIRGLALTLIVTSLFTVKSYKDAKSKTIEMNISNSEQQYKLLDAEAIVEKLQLENSLNCLSGSITVEAHYGDEEISNKDVAFKWLKDSLQSLNTKSIKVNSTYKIMFSYDLNDIVSSVQITGYEITFNLSPNKLKLIQCELETANSIDSDVGLFRSKFSPQELSSINKRTRDLAYNKILSMKDTRNQAIENVKTDLEQLVSIFVNDETKINFNVPSFDVVEQDNEINIISYNLHN